MKIQTPYLFTLLLGMLFVLAGGTVQAQQDQMYSQYMFNGLVLNPAYAGSKGYISTTLIAREQWTGIDDAPSTQSFSLHGPSRNQRHGFGLMAINDRAGAISDLNISATYAYRIPVGKTGALALGLSGGVNNYRTNFNGLRRQTVLDPTIAANDVNMWMPDANAGIYFNTERVYLGLSARQLIPTELHNTGAGTFESRRERHYLATAGLVLDLGRNVKFKPSTLVKYHPAAPVQLDLNASFLFVEQFWVGGSWRSNDAWVVILEWQPTKALRFGYSYDRSISQLQGLNNGSHEFMLGFDLHFRSRRNVSPRYF